MTDKKNIDIKSVEMAKVEDMVLDISWCVAEEAAEYLEIIMQGMTKDGIRSLMHKETGDMMFAGDSRHSFNFNDCGTVELTLEDLYLAFELGFSNINQICRVKKRKGSLNKILNEY